MSSQVDDLDKHYQASLTATAQEMARSIVFYLEDNMKEIIADRIRTMLDDMTIYADDDRLHIGFEIDGGEELLVMPLKPILMIETKTYLEMIDDEEEFPAEVQEQRERIIRTRDLLNVCLFEMDVALAKGG